MTERLAQAERLLRRFARDTNLLIAGRPFAITGNASVADALAGMVRGMGGLVVEPDAQSPELVTIDVDAESLSLGGQPLVSRGDGAGRLNAAAAHMPVSRALAETIARDGTLHGLRIGVSMTLEPKTAQLALLLHAAGAETAVYAHPDETDEEVAEALRARGVPVDADSRLGPAEERDAALGFIDRGFDVMVDDGSHVTRLAHEARPREVSRWIGATEETTSGLTPLRRMDAAGALATPVVAVNDAATKTGFDNRYGTGQSCVFAIADLLDTVGVSVRDQPALVMGYGPVGQGVAAHLRALGAELAVAETDPVRALLAAHDGARVGRAADLAPGALVISCTGVANTVTAEILRAAAAVAVAGGVPGEIDLDGALAPGGTLEDHGAHVERLSDTGTWVLDRGGCINVTAAEGNPIEIMDLSFATQMAAIVELVTTRPAVGVHALSEGAVAAVAELAARARGMELDSPVAAPATATDWHSPRYVHGRAAAQDLDGERA